jgi:hypothetical protein
VVAADCFFIALSLKSLPDSERWGVNMNGGAQTENPVVPFAPTDKGTSSNGGDQLDKAGQSILHLLHKAAGVAEKTANTRWIWLRSCLTSYARPSSASLI